jgi:hypothetical protein
MSTKIYNGIKFNTNNIETLHQHMNELREEFGVIRDKNLLNELTESCFSLYDRRTITPPTIDYQPVMNQVHADYYNRQEEVRIKQVRDPSVDFSFEICVFPYNNEFYGMFFTEQKEFSDILQSKDYVEYFGYWDNVDPDEDVSESDWELRGKIWDKLLGEDAIPSRHGFTYEIVPLTSVELYNITAQLIIDNAPDIITRAEHIARDNVYKKYASNRTINTTNVMKIYRGFLEHVKSDKGSAELKLETEFVAKQLKLVLDRSDLIK